MYASLTVPAIETEATSLACAMRSHPAIKKLFAPRTVGRTEELRSIYLHYLKVTMDYVAYSVPMLRAAGEALRNGDEADRAWSQLFLHYADDEMDSVHQTGHHVWARNDMKALDAPASLLDAPVHPSVIAYGRFFVEEAHLHPYAILGAKGVLEHLSIKIADDLAAKVSESGIPNADKAVSFMSSHGVLDIDHVREGDANLARITEPSRCMQILAGTYFTSGSYRAFLQQIPVFQGKEQNKAEHARQDGPRRAAIC